MAGEFCPRLCPFLNFSVRILLVSARTQRTSHGLLIARISMRVCVKSRKIIGPTVKMFKNCSVEKSSEIYSENIPLKSLAFRRKGVSISPLWSSPGINYCQAGCNSLFLFCYWLCWIRSGAASASKSNVFSTVGMEDFRDARWHILSRTSLKKPSRFQPVVQFSPLSQRGALAGFGYVPRKRLRTCQAHLCEGWVCSPFRGPWNWVTCESGSLTSPFPHPYRALNILCITQLSSVWTSLVCKLF